MVKLRFTSLDLRAMITSLEESVIGYRITNIYDINPKTYVLKLAKPDSKIFLLIESGIRIHATSYAREKELIPSGFTMKLRKHLRTRRVEKIEMLGADRLVVLTCGSGPCEHKLILELYDKGNIVLTDGDNTVLTLLRNSKHDPDARVTVGETYGLVVRRDLPALSREWLVGQMQAAEPSSTIRQLLMRLLPLGKDVTDHCLLSASVTPNTKLSTQLWLSDADVDRLLTAIMDTTRYFHQAGAAPPAGIIVLKDPAPGTAAPSTEEGAPQVAAAAAVSFLGVGRDRGARVDDKFCMHAHPASTLHRIFIISDPSSYYTGRLKLRGFRSVRDASAWREKPHTLR